jgi:hypothetical protein
MSLNSSVTSPLGRGRRGSAGAQPEPPLPVLTQPMRLPGGSQEPAKLSGSGRQVRTPIAQPAPL